DAAMNLLARQAKARGSSLHRRSCCHAPLLTKKREAGEVWYEPARINDVSFCPLPSMAQRRRAGRAVDLAGPIVRARSERNVSGGTAGLRFGHDCGKVLVYRSFRGRVK